MLTKLLLLTAVLYLSIIVLVTSESLCDTCHRLCRESSKWCYESCKILCNKDELQDVNKRWRVKPRDDETSYADDENAKLACRKGCSVLENNKKMRCEEVCDASELPRIPDIGHDEEESENYDSRKALQEAWHELELSLNTPTEDELTSQIKIDIGKLLPDLDYKHISVRCTALCAKWNGTLRKTEEPKDCDCDKIAVKS